MPVLKPLHDAAGLTRLVVSTYQAVSGAGLAGVAELDDQLGPRSTARPPSPSTAGRRPGPTPRCSPTASPTTSCPSPARWSTTARARPTRSRSSGTRAARSSDIPDLAVTCTCVRVPVFTGHSLAIVAEFAGPLAPDEAAKLLDGAPGRRALGPAHAAAGRRASTRRWSGASVPADGGARRAGAVRERRQPAQGRRPQRGADRRVAGAPGHRRLTAGRPPGQSPVTRFVRASTATRLARLTAWSPNRS